MEENLIKKEENGVKMNGDLGTNDMEELEETVCNSIYSFFFSGYFFFTSICSLVVLVCFYPSGWKNWNWWEIRELKVENNLNMLNILKRFLSSGNMCENCEFFIIFMLFLCLCTVNTRTCSYFLMFVRILIFACVFGLLCVLCTIFSVYLFIEIDEIWEGEMKIKKLTKICVCFVLFLYNVYAVILMCKKGLMEMRKVLREFCCVFVYFGKYTLMNFSFLHVPFERFYTTITLFTVPASLYETTFDLLCCPFGLTFFSVKHVVRYNLLIMRTFLFNRLCLLFLVIILFYTLCLDLLFFAGQNQSMLKLEYLYQNSQTFLFLNCVYTLTSFFILHKFLPSLLQICPEHQVNMLQLNDLSTEFDTGMVFITEPIRIGNKIKTFKCLADTGASVSVINHRYAARYFKNLIAACSPLKVTVPNGDKTILQTCVPITFIDETSLKPIWTERFYILPKLTQDVIASKHLLKRLGYELTKVSKKFSHPSVQDETFGSFCNWHDPKFKANITSQVAAIAPPDYKSTPYAQHQLLKTGAYLQNVILSPSSVPQTAILNHISNFRATRKEIEAARNTPPDKIFQRVDLEHLRDRPWLYKRMRYLCYEKFKHVWAKHTFSLSTIKGFEYSFKIKDSFKNTRIHRPQYHLNPEKRAAVIQHTLRNIANGLFEPAPNSVHNVPILVINKSGRLRPAFDLRLLNEAMCDEEAHMPSYNWLFELLRGKGCITGADQKNFFENIVLPPDLRDYAAVTTPLGRFRLTRCSYGFKTAPTLAQSITDAMIKPIKRSAAYIDDIFIKHRPNASDEELAQQAEQLLSRCSQFGTLLHPEKMKFFMNELVFLGYVFNQKGSSPEPKYIRKVLEVARPRTVKQVQAFVGLLQYIARYVKQMSKWTYYFSILTRGNGPGTRKINWGPEQEKAWLELREAVKNIKLLHHPQDDGEFLIQCDASGHAIGAVLYQRQFDASSKQYEWKIIEFYSKQIEARLMSHPVMVKECLAFVHAMNHWSISSYDGNFLLTRIIRILSTYLAPKLTQHPR